MFFIIQEGEPAIFECRITGNPKPEVNWYKSDNTLIRDSPNYIHLEEEKDTYKLVIRVRFIFFFPSKKKLKLKNLTSKFKRKPI